MTKYADFRDPREHGTYCVTIPDSNHRFRDSLWWDSFQQQSETAESTSEPAGWAAHSQLSFVPQSEAGMFSLLTQGPGRSGIPAMRAPNSPRFSPTPSGPSLSASCIPFVSHSRHSGTTRFESHWRQQAPSADITQLGRRGLDDGTGPPRQILPQRRL
jgi:hypothetical protein